MRPCHRSLHLKIVLLSKWDKDMSFCFSFCIFSFCSILTVEMASFCHLHYCGGGGSLLLHPLSAHFVILFRSVLDPWNTNEGSIEVCNSVSFFFHYPNDTIPAISPLILIIELRVSLPLHKANPFHRQLLCLTSRTRHLLTSKGDTGTY